MEDDFKDERFAHVGKDPRFRRLNKDKRKVKIDKRFKGMFKDEKFKVKYSVDKRGRPINISTSENLQKYYELSSEESDSSDTEVQEDVTKKSIKKQNVPRSDKNIEQNSEVFEEEMRHSQKLSPKKNKTNRNYKTTSTTNKNGAVSQSRGKDSEKGANDYEDSLNSSTEEQAVSSDGEKDSDDDRKDTDDEEQTSTDTDDSDLESETSEINADYARGAGVIDSSSEEDSDESTDVSDDEKEEEFDHKWGEIDKEAPEAEEITPRLALCNLDWDRIKAHDIMVLLNSFKPSGGNIKSVHIYPSEFGKERMKEEDQKGPSEIVDNKKEAVNSKNAEGSEYHTEKLRQYQLNRLKYYYAVVESDTSETANHIYSQCDGMEYETTGNRLDLRFIPNGMSFDDEPKSVATDVPDTTTYKPSTFSSSALQQSTVECTWDETDQDRIALTMRKFDKDDLEEMDLKDYLASDSDVDEENPYGDLEDNADFGKAASDSEGEEVQIEKYRNLLKNLGDKEDKADNDMEMEFTWEPGLKETTEQLVKKKAKEKDMTPWEQYLDKKKEKNRMKREQKKTEEIVDSDKGEDSESDNIPDDVDLNDPYFQEELSKMKSGTDQEKKSNKKKKHRKKLTPEEIKEKEEREAELKLLLMDEDDKRQHFNLKQLMEPDNKKSKKKKKFKKRKDAEESTKVEDNFKIDMEDTRFSVLFENPHYNIDPSAPEFKKTKVMDSLIDEKLKRAKKKKKRKGSDAAVKLETLDHEVKKQKHSDLNVSLTSENVTTNAKNMELASLVKSVKARTKLAKSKNR